MQKQILSEIKLIEHANEFFLNVGPLRKAPPKNVSWISSQSDGLSTTTATKLMLQ